MWKIKHDFIFSWKIKSRIRRWFSIIQQLFICFIASAPVLTDKATNKLVQSGKDVILSCSFQSIVTFSWLKNGNKITYDNQTFAKNISQTLQVLNIKNVQDTATYTCVGKNTDGISSGDINVTLVGKCFIDC